jgi:hypothetical protein
MFVHVYQSTWHHIQYIEIFISTAVTTSDLTCSLLCSVDQTKGKDASSSRWRTVGAAPSTAEHNISQPGNSTEMPGRERRRGRRKCSYSVQIPFGPSMMTWDECSLWYFHFICWYCIVTDLETLLMLQLIWCDWIFCCWIAIFIFVSINVFIVVYMLPVIDLFWSLN